MHYWISLTVNTNVVSHIRGVGVYWALLRCIEIVSSTDKDHFLVIELASGALQDKNISLANMIKTYGMNILFCLILWTNISHSITTSIPRILEKSSPYINVRRSSKPVPYYHNSSATMGCYYPATSNPIQVQLIRLNQIETVSKLNPFHRFVKNVIRQ